PSLAAQHPASQEPCGERTRHRKRQRLLTRRLRSLGGRRHRGVRGGLFGLPEQPLLLRRHRRLGALKLLLGLRLDVSVLRQRRDRVTQLLASGLDLAADLLGIAALGHCRALCARVLAHCTSSFTLSLACSGTGGVACWTLFLPWSTSSPTSAPSSTVTISAASHEATAVASARIAVAISAPSA